MTSESIVMETEIPNSDEHEKAGKPITYFSVVPHITTMSERSDIKGQELPALFLKHCGMVAVGSSSGS